MNRGARVRAFVGLAFVVAAGSLACRRTPPPEQTAPVPGSVSANASASAPSAHVPPDPCRVGGARLPLLARWTPTERAELVSVMKRGIAIVAADDCRGVRLLPRCTATGRYGYLGTTASDRTVDLGTEEEVRINAPTGTSGFGADAGVASLHLSARVVGRRATPRPILDPAELSGEDCAGATHFVSYVAIGAVGPEAAAACTGARAGTTTSTPGCDAVVEARIEPLAPLGSLVGFDKAPADAVVQIGMCPSGMVVTAGRCARPPVSGPYLCSFGDANECRTQCDRGDVNSCDVLGFMLRAGKGVPLDLTKALATYEAACTHDDAIA